MKKFETPAIEVIAFTVEDVITESGTSNPTGPNCTEEAPL